MGRVVRGGGRPLRGADHQASRRFLLWPSKNANPHREGYQASRDLVGEFAAAVRARGLRWGSTTPAAWTGPLTTGPSWTSRPLPGDPATGRVRLLRRNAPAGVDRSLRARSALERHRLSARGQSLRVVRLLLQSVPDGVINDRFGQPEIATTARGAPRPACCSGQRSHRASRLPHA